MHMASRANITARGAGNAVDSSLYMVLKVSNNGELQEVSSQVRPGSSAHLFAITSQDSRHENMTARPSGSRKNSFRHPRPCGGCSATKSRCTPLSEDPMLCVRCKSKNLTQCPPHVPWALRRASGERRGASGSPQPQAITQSCLLPEDTTCPVPPASPAPIAMHYYSDPYSMQVGPQQHGQHVDGAMEYSAYSYAPFNPEENLSQQCFYNIEPRDFGESYSQSEPLCYPSFPPEPIAQQSCAQGPDVQPPAQYHQPTGQHTYW